MQASKSKKIKSKVDVFSNAGLLHGQQLVFFAMKITSTTKIKIVGDCNYNLLLANSTILSI